MSNSAMRRTMSQNDPVEVSVPARRTQAVIVLLVRGLVAFIGASLAVAGAPLMMVGVGIPLWAIGMALLLAAVDGDR